MLDLFGETEKPLVGEEPFLGPSKGMLRLAAEAPIRAGAKLATYGAMVGAGLAPHEKVTPDKDPGRIFPRREDFYRFVEDYIEPIDKAFAPDPATLTTAGKIISAVSELPVMALAGGVPAIAGSVTTETGMSLEEQGVDSKTNALVSGGVGLAMIPLMALPQAGNTLLKTVLLSASNPATGAATDYAAQQALEAKGYHEQAKSFDPFDPAARSVDTTLGIIFGGLAHYGRWRAKASTEVVDAIDTVEKARQADALNPFQQDTSQGKVHGEVLNTALEALEEGRPVDVAGRVIESAKKKEPTYTADRFRTDVQEVFGLDDSQADAALALVAARAKVQGADLDTFIAKNIAGIKEGIDGDVSALFQDRPVVPPFFSKLLVEVDGLQQEKWSSGDLLNKLRKTQGVKADEITWTGLDEYLAGKKSVTREEIKTFLEENQVRVREVVKGAGLSAAEQAEYDRLTRPVAPLKDTELLRLNELMEKKRSLTEYGDYVLDGGENYRELLLTMPDKAGTKEYRSPHFNERNVLAHVRFNEHTGANGERVLHLEEMQSDWAQDRRGGKNVPDAPMTDATDKWTGLAMRRMLRWAAEHGFERITWTTGEQQGFRYDLSRKLDEITYSRTKGGEWQIDGYKGGASKLSRKIADADLSDAVGKDMAAKMRRGEGIEKFPGTEMNVRSLTGSDLVIGGEGMKGFYDQIVPAIAAKLGKRFGAKVEDVDLPEAGTVHSLEITDAMRDSLLYEGQPLFQGEKGAVSFLSDGRAVIHALEGADFSTVIHELGHVFENSLTRTEKHTFDTWMHSQVPGVKWSTGQRELFARAFERYLAEGKAPVPEMQGIFDKFKSWLLEIYQRITGTAIDVKLNDNVRAAFDRMLFADLLKKEVSPEVRQAREEVGRVASELDTELQDMRDSFGMEDMETVTNKNLEPRSSILDPAPPKLEPLPIGSAADIVNNFARTPDRISSFLGDFLQAEATALESAESGKVVIDGYEKSASWSDAPPWFLERNRKHREIGATPVSKDSAISALRKAAKGEYQKLTPGQKDMVLEAIDYVSRQVDAHAREIDAGDLQVGDRFTTTSLEARTVAGERNGHLILENGETVSMDRTLKVLGEVDSSGRPGDAPATAADLILREQGDFELFDGTDADGNERRRSAAEILDEARNTLAVEQNRSHLYHRAAVCLNMG
jgi:hypothetical protein